jgi:hypothetical protein
MLVPDMSAFRPGLRRLAISGREGELDALEQMLGELQAYRVVRIPTWSPRTRTTAVSRFLLLQGGAEPLARL